MESLNEFDNSPIERFVNKDELRDFYLREVVESKLVDSYEDDLKKFGYSEEQINEFREAVLKLDDMQKDALFAFPWELKQRSLPFNLKQIKENKKTIAGMVSDIVRASSLQHRAVAYHCSDQNIGNREIKNANGAVHEWVIKGTEPDHRDNDIPMAYYSFDYANLYRKKNPKFLYIVSAQINEKTGHKRDEDGSWGRAPSLSVIEKLDIKQVDALVDKLVSEHMQDEDNKKATPFSDAA